MGAFDDALRAGLQPPGGGGLMGNPGMQQLLQGGPAPGTPPTGTGGEFFGVAPPQPPAGDFMDEIFNQGLMPQLMDAFRQSGNAGQYAGHEFDYLKDSGSPFFRDLGQWANREQGGNMMDLIHPLLRGQPGPR
jgi:hypothetical protein